ncbi:MAG: M42 family peptidase, partial [Opitutales bacterium]|nr:M42 family peptidase [Opitutales bacterium]
MAKKVSAPKSEKTFEIPAFLRELLEAKAPTGHEFEAQAVCDKYMKTVADEYRKDVLGNRIATLNPKAKTSVMFAGHIDELGLQISYVDDKGFLYFNLLGGHDLIIPSGRRVLILTKNGIVLGVTGKRAVHLMSPSERT